MYDIDVDLQLSAVKLERMFMCEMEHLVDTESISQDDMSALLEICEPLHVTEEKAHLDCRAPASRRPSALVVPTGTRPRDEHGLRQYSSIEYM